MRYLIVLLTLSGSLIAQVGRYELKQIIIPQQIIQDGKDSGDRILITKDTITVLLDTQEGTMYELSRKVTLIQSDSVRYQSTHDKVEIFTGYPQHYSRAIDGNYTADQVVQILNAYLRATELEAAMIRIDLQNHPVNLYRDFSDSIEFVNGNYRLK